ncbi:MAG: hypothetical protein K2H15_04540, partial [Muribaculaceae bacterium]|nr:hypothetical protein [Muribaculaceae bacterium]
MNRLLTFALCLAAVGTEGAQKAVVDQAAKLSGKADGLSQARELIQQAMQNPETQNDARTYYIAGKIEFDAFDNATKTKMISPDDPSANPVTMADELMKGYNYFLKALPLDSVPNEKGQIKPKFSKDIVNKIAGHNGDFFTAGANYFNEKKYYPEAYDAFMVFGELPETGRLGKLAGLIDPSQISTAFFNAGLAAYSGNEFEKSAEAFAKARQAGYPQAEAYIYGIACWQAVAQQNPDREKEVQAKIFEIAQAGHEKFGLEQPLFINNLINSMVVDGNVDAALEKLNAVIAENPENAALFGLRGYVNDRIGKDAESEADYRKAAALPSADFETLKNASKKIFRIGTTKWNEIEGASAEAAAARQNVKANYFEAAKEIANKAKAIKA